MSNSYKQTPGAENTTNQYSNTPFEYQNQQANLTKQPQQPQPQSQSQQYQQQQQQLQMNQNSGQGHQSVSVVNNRESNFNFDDFKIQLKSHDRIIILKKILEIYTICKETQIHKTAENLMLDLSKEHFIEIHKSSVQQTINIIDKVGEIINKADYSNEFQELRFDLPYIHKQYQNLVEICVEHECVNTGDQSYKCIDKKHNRVQLKKINELLKQFKTIELNQQTKVEIYYNDEVFKYLKTVEEIDFSDDSIRTKCGNFPYIIKSLVQTQKQNEDLESEIKSSFEKIMNTMKSTEPLQTLIKPEIQKHVTKCSHQTQEEVRICLEQDCKFSTTTLCKECQSQHENHRTISIKELTEFQSNKDNNIERYMEAKKIFQENQYFDQLIQIFCIIDSENLNLAENQCLERLGTKLRELQIYPLLQNKNSIFQSSSELLSKMKVNQNEFKQMEELSNLKCDQHMENQVTHICLDQTCKCHFICISCEQYHPAHHREPISEALKTILSQNQDFSQIIKRESENFKKIKNQVIYFGKDLKVLNFLRQFCKPSEQPKDWKQFALKYREYNSSKNKIVESTKYISLFHSQYAFQETFIKLLDRLNEQELYKVNIKVNEQLQFKCVICQRKATHIQATGKIVCEEHQEQKQIYSQISEYLEKVMEKERKFDLQTSNWEKLLQKFFNLQIEFMGNMYEALFPTIPRNFNRQQMNQEQGSMNSKLNLYMQQICLKQNNLRFMDYFVNELERFHESSFKKCDHKYQLIYDRNLFYNFDLKNTECAKVIVKNNSQKNSFKLIGLYIGNIQTKDGGTITISLIKDRDSKTKNIKSSQLKAINNSNISLTYIELDQNEQVLIEMNKSIEIVITIDQASQVKFHRKHIEQDILLINTIQDIQISFPEGKHKNNLTIIGNEDGGLIQELVLEPIQ